MYTVKYFGRRKKTQQRQCKDCSGLTVAKNGLKACAILGHLKKSLQPNEALDEAAFGLDDNE